MITLNKTPDWSKGLLPCIVQHQHTGVVLMQGFMNETALEHTLSSGLVTFYSRSKARLWTKGESSGNHLVAGSVALDCDADSLLVLALPKGPTCHLGTEHCWGDAPVSDYSFLGQLETLVASRKQSDASSSYTAALYASGIKRIAQKVGEEGVETALAATVGDKDELKNEAADLLYHLLVLMQASDLSLSDAIRVLRQRQQQAE